VTEADYDRWAVAAQRGDARALARLYRDLAPALLGYLGRYVPDPADAEDILHDTFVRVFEGRRRYRPSGRFRSWLFTVATRLALDRARARRTRYRLEPAVRETLGRHPAEDATDRLCYDELRRRVDAALDDLPPAYAAAFHLRVREGFSYAEIASIHDAPEATLRSRVHRALARIRTALENDPPTPSESGTRSKEEKDR